MSQSSCANYLTLCVYTCKASKLAYLASDDPQSEWTQWLDHMRSSPLTSPLMSGSFERQEALFALAFAERQFTGSERRGQPMWSNHRAVGRVASQRLKRGGGRACGGKSLAESPQTVSHEVFVKDECPRRTAHTGPQSLQSCYEWCLAPAGNGKNQRVCRDQTK